MSGNNKVRFLLKIVPVDFFNLDNNGEQIQAGLSNDSHQGTKVSVGDWATIISEISANGKVDVDGASGPINFDANGDVLSRFTRQQFNSEGKYEFSGCWEGDGSTCAD